jgi:hypothetical protein
MLFIFLLAAVDTLSQGTVVLNDKRFQAQRNVDTAVYNSLTRQALFNTLDKSEKELLYWVNLMRKDPMAFKNNYVLPFLEQFPEAQSPESKSLVKRMSVLASPFSISNFTCSCWHCRGSCKLSGR